jgi:hypothetical protein
MYIVKTVAELAENLRQPNPNVIYCYLPDGYVLTSNKAEEIFGTMSDVMVYGDVEITDGKNSAIKFNPSFDTSIIIRRIPLDSPLFIRTNRPIHINCNSLNEAALQILSQIVGLHIPEIIARWTQTF